MRTIALPIETKAREFLGKLWLALNLVGAGYEVALGPVGEIRSTLDLTQPGVYITKDPGDPSVQFFKDLRRAGIRVCGLDPEGGVFSAIDTYTQKKSETLNHMAAYFAWGSKQADALEQAHGKTSNVYVTGNPRFDLLRPGLRRIYAETAADIQESYGSYILINTNFTLANPVDSELVKRNVEKVFNNDVGRYSYFSRIFHLFIEAAFFLASEMPDMNIVIRPHPSEDHGTYEEIFDGHENVFVRYTHDAQSWIMGAKCVVHHDCTTGIESALLNKNVVSYQPVPGNEYGAELPRLVSRQVSTRGDLRDELSHVAAGDTDYELDPDQRGMLKSYFQNFDELAAENIRRVVDDLEFPASIDVEQLRPNHLQNAKRRVKASPMSEYAVKVYDKYHSALGDELSPRRRKARRQRFSGLSEEELRTEAQNFNKVIDVEGLQVERIPVTKHAFTLSRR